MSQSQANVVTGSSDLLQIQHNPSETYILGADIDMSLLATMYPIGAPDGTAFTGTLIGNGYSIKNANLIGYQDQLVSGLFHSIDGATFEDITFENIAMSSVPNGGIIAGSASGDVTLTNVTVNGAMDVLGEEGDQSVGALAGTCDGTITLDGCDITMSQIGAWESGGVVGRMTGGSATITDTTVNAEFSGPPRHTGCVFGVIVNDSCVVNVTNCNLNSLPTDAASAGGVVGESQHSEMNVSDSEIYMEGSTTGNMGGVCSMVTAGITTMDSSTVNIVITAGGNGAGPDTGGCVGSSDTSVEVTGCEVSVIAEGQSGYCGGVVGTSSGFDGTPDLTVQNVTSSVELPDVTSGFCGGIVGMSDFTTYSITGCDINFTAGDGMDYLGGIIGQSTSGSESGGEGVCVIDDCTVSVDISGGYSGGVVGSHESSYGSTCEISNVRAVGRVEGDGYNGSVVGYGSNIEITDTTTAVDIDSTGYAGGVVGNAYTVTCTRVVILGDVRSTGRCAMLGPYPDPVTVSECAFLGDVYNDGSDGAMLALAPYGTIEDVYIKGDLHANSNGGSFLVSQYGEVGNMSNIYMSGGVKGENADSVSVAQSPTEFGEGVYWNSETTGVEQSNGATTLTTEQMTGQNAEDNMDSLDFSDIWNWTRSYPVFQWQSPEMAEITGEIADAFGNPVEGDAIAFGDSVFSTDPDGEYTAEIGGGESYDVKALGGAYTSAIYTSHDMDISLQYSGIRVEVRHPYTDEPIESAPVRINGGGILTDSDGIAELPKMPGGEYNISVLGIWDETISLEDSGDTETLLFDGSDRSITADITVSHGESGNGLEEIDITLPQVGAETFTNPDGEATLVAEGVDGRAFIYIAKEDPRFETQSIEVPLDESQIEREVDLYERDPMRK